MASVNKVRPGVYKVRWRFGGGKTASEHSKTFRAKWQADAFALALHNRGQRVRPDDADVLDLSIIDPARETRHAPKGPTFAQVAEEWLAHKTLRPQSRSAYRQVLRDYLLPRWGDAPVADITERDLRDLIDSHGIEAEGRGAHIWIPAKGVIRYAHLKGLRPDNPAAVIRLPHKTTETPAVFLTPEEVDLLLVAAGQHRSDGRNWALMCRAAVTTGLRVGELCGLRVRDLDMRNPEKPRLHVRRNWRIDHEGPTKSKSGLRSVVIEPELARDLKTMTVGRPPTAALFPNPEGGHFHTRTIGTRWVTTVRRAQKRGLECEPRFHDLRHTHASSLLESGVPLLEVKDRMGHRDISTTARYYGHIGPSSDDRMLAALRTRRLNAV